MAASRIDQILASEVDRSPDFGQLHEYYDGRLIVVRTYAPAPNAMWRRLCELWTKLPSHPHILDSLANDGETLVLRYAAIDWAHDPTRLDATHVTPNKIAGWGIQIARAFECIACNVPEAELWRFLNPVVWIDADHAVRLAFLPTTNEQPYDERAVVFAIGTVVRKLAVYTSDGLKALLERCLHVKPNKRYATIYSLRTAFRVVACSDSTRADDAIENWQLIDEAVGWLALEKPLRAQELLTPLVRRPAHPSFADLALHRANSALGIVVGSIVPKPPKPKSTAVTWLTWAEAEPLGRTLESERAFREALEVYDRTYTGTSDVVLFTAMSRCCLALGRAPSTIDYAQRALAVSSKHTEALSLRTRGYLLASKPADALKAATVWLAANPDDASAHYCRGRALLLAEQFSDARDAFDRAFALQPTMLEAMLLRREADRAVNHRRDQLGTQPALRLDLPDHLAHLRELIANNKIDDAIAILEQPAHSSDSLVRAQLLSFNQRHAEALELFEALEIDARDSRAARLGRAHSLLALNRAEEALAAFYSLDHDLDVLEGRRLALHKLGTY